LYNNIGGCAPLYTNISNVSGNGTCSLISNTLNTCYGFTTNGDTIGIVWTTASNPLSSACFTTGTIVCAGASGSPYNTIISGDYSKCTASSLSAVCMFVFDRSVCSGAFCGSFVGGGSLNTASGNYNAVVGGQCNFASCGVHNTIGGGWANCIFSGSCNTISGGRNNIINVAGTGNSNTISGGYNNLIQAGSYNFIGNGYTNSHTCKSYMAVLGGGRNNTASGCYSSILGGAFNCACCLAGCSVVGGGCRNTVTSNYASVFGGACNTASGAYSNVAGGWCNTASGNYSSILGGNNNNTNNQACSFIIGQGITASQPNYTYVNNLSSQGNIVATGAVYGSTGVSFLIGVTTYTFQLSDNGNLIGAFNGNASLSAIPSASINYPVGFQTAVMQLSTARVSLSGTGSPTVNQANGYYRTTKQYSSATLMYLGSPAGWVIFGDVSA
jgi:hypothetical protein